MSKRREPKKPHLELDLRRYAPEFSEADHEAAREEGYEDATDRWAVNMDIRMDDDYHRRVHEMGKASRRGALESVGTPFEKLGALSDAASKLPNSPEYCKPEIRAPKDDYQRRAAIHGLKNRLIRWMEACERDGIAVDSELCPDGLEFEQYRHRQREGQEIRERLEAMGADFEASIEEAESGDIAYEERFVEKPESDDPEIRRVLDEYEKDKESFETQHGWQKAWDEDNDE